MLGYGRFALWTSYHSTSMNTWRQVRTTESAVAYFIWEDRKKRCGRRSGANQGCSIVQLKHGLKLASVCISPERRTVDEPPDSKGPITAPGIPERHASLSCQPWCIGGKRKLRCQPVVATGESRIRQRDTEDIKSFPSKSSGKVTGTVFAM